MFGDAGVVRSGVTSSTRSSITSRAGETGMSDQRKKKGPTYRARVSEFLRSDATFIRETTMVLDFYTLNKPIEGDAEALLLARRILRRWNKVDRLHYFRLQEVVRVTYSRK